MSGPARFLSKLRSALAGARNVLARHAFAEPRLGIVPRLSIAFGAVAVLAVVANMITEHGNEFVRAIEQVPAATVPAAGTGDPDALPAALDRFQRAVLARVDASDAARITAHREAIAALDQARASFFALVASSAGTTELADLDAGLNGHLDLADVLLRAADARRRVLDEYGFEFESLNARVKQTLARPWDDPERAAARALLTDAERILEGIGRRIRNFAPHQGYGQQTVQAITRGERSLAVILRDPDGRIAGALGAEWVAVARRELERLTWLRGLLLRTDRQREDGAAAFADSHAAIAARVRRLASQFELAVAQRQSAEALSAISAQESRRRTLLAWLSVCVLLLLLTTSASTVVSVVRPVRGLLQATRRLAQGEPDVRAPRGGILELDTLAASFNEMAEQLTAAQSVARQYHLQLEAKVEERTRQLQHLAAHDALTRLPNRRQLLAQLSETLKLAAERRAYVGVFFLDLDHFKHINDSMGHLFGDRLLQAIADRLRAATASYGFSARLGGDEFTVVYPHAAAREEIERAGEQLVRAFQEPLVVDGRELLMGLSVGASIFPLHGRRPEELLRAADAALFHAKAQGRSQIRMFSPELLQAATTKFATEQGLRRAIERGEFELVFQPEVNVATFEAHLVEALLRWRLPDGTCAAPQDFMRVAEECGLIRDIGDWVLRAAVGHAARWYGSGWRDIRVAINVSSLQLFDTSFVARLRDLLREHGLPPRCIEIELTENVLQTAPHTIDAVRELDAAGVGIALDDFGAGFSSLISLERLPLSRVKLDRNLISSIDTSARCQAIARAIIALCQSLGLPVTAEGVERREQLAWLLDQPAMSIQGYLLSGPVASADLLAAVAAIPDRMRALLHPQPAAPAVQLADFLAARRRQDR